MAKAKIVKEVERKGTEKVLNVFYVILIVASILMVVTGIDGTVTIMSFSIPLSDSIFLVIFFADGIYQMYRYRYLKKKSILYLSIFNFFMFLATVLSLIFL